MPSGIKKFHNDFIKEVYGLVGNDYTILGEYINAQIKILIKHNICNHEWESYPNNFLKHQKCPNCANLEKSKKMARTLEEYKNEVYNLVKDEYMVLDDTYVNANTKIKMKHNICNNVFYQRPLSFINHGHRCPICMREKSDKKRKKTNDWFLEKVEKLVGKEYEFLEEYNGNQHKILVRHNVCSNEYYVAPSKFLNNRRCPICYNKNKGDKTRRPVEKIYEVIDKLNYTFIEFPDGYTGDKSKVTVECKNRHITTKSIASIISGNGCLHCNKPSKGEQKIEDYLIKNNIIFERQYKFNDCRNKNPLPFDFAIKDKDNNLTHLIEYDGKQHFEPIKYYGGEKGFEYRKKNDNIKNKYCKRKNINLIRVPYWDFKKIDNILFNKIQIINI
jgi:hypothetical protein